jgi:hypothetical protein
MPKIIMISGNGTGSGKTTLARIVSLDTGLPIVSFASVARHVLHKFYKDDAFLSKRQEDKLRIVAGKTVRQHLIDYCEKKREEDRYYFARLLHETMPIAGAIIDDLRFVAEKEFFVLRCGNVLHYHVETLGKPENSAENQCLLRLADVLYRWHYRESEYVSARFPRNEKEYVD